MIPLEQLVEESLEEAFESETDYEGDLSALSHALGQVWRDMPPALKSYLISEAKGLLRQLREDPKGVLGRIVALAGLLVLRRRLPPPKAVRTATLQVVRNRRLKWRRQAKRPVMPGRRIPPPRPLTKTRWQRGRRGNRFETWL